MNCVSRGGCYLVNSSCDLQEDNQWKKESYEAYWISLVLETRPQYKLTLSEKDNIHRESYKQQQVVHFMVQRYPSQTLKLGSDGRAMTEHQLPLFDTSRGSTTKEQQAVTQETRDEQGVSATAQDLSKPSRVNFRASGLMSSPKEISERVQRRE
ncbi:telethonin [Notolabrus celidotus]|uniref:telethonin n=1 Tax=Notolabrus celidotus TaxID=1203425 RepID=UPI0014907894|nr:telethonin [Notolabrus celidotus]